MISLYLFSRDFTSDHTLRVEYGIANEMEQYESNHKVQQMMGDKRERSEILKHGTSSLVGVSSTKSASMRVPR